VNVDEMDHVLNLERAVLDLASERDALAYAVRALREREEVALMTLAHSTDTVARLEKRVRDLESDLAQQREVVELARAVVRCWEDDERIDAVFDDLRAAVNRTEVGS
jgi:hypothetical protein